MKHLAMKWQHGNAKMLAREGKSTLLATGVCIRSTEWGCS